MPPTTTPIRTLVVGALLLAPAAAWAQAPDPGPARAPAERTPVRATIVLIDGVDVFVDVDRSQVEPDTELVVYRRVQVRHPISGRTLVDRFPIGTLRIARSGETLSLARVEGTPDHPFEVGDAAEGGPVPAAQAAPEASAAAVTADPARAPAGIETSGVSNQGKLDPETYELLRHFYATLGKPPAQRAALYRRYLAKHPATRFSPSVKQELAYLEALPVKPAAPAPPARKSLAGSVRIDAITRARQAEAIELAAAHAREAELRSLLVHARPRGSEQYTTVPMELDGRGHGRATLPAEVAGPDGVEYFVEAISRDGRSEQVLAGPAAPQHALGIATGADGPLSASGPSTRVRFTSELVSFDGVSGRDYFLLSEGDFLYRVRMGALHGVRMGYGHYRGQGGTVEELDELQLDPEEAGFSYGFAQADLELSELIGASLRATIGLGRPEQADQQRDGVTGGFQLRARIGRADGTHLVLAGELMPEIGQRAYLGLRWEAIEDMPMGAEVHVTDQPVNSDELAVRLVYEAGYRITDRIALALRPSYQLRTIKHAGPGIGMAATFDW